MKKIGLIFLSLMFVFMVSCSGNTDPDNGSTNPSDTAFLNNVKGKYAGIKTPQEAGFFFSEDGRTVQNKASGVGVTYVFKSAESSTKAIYTAGTIEAVFRIGDGNLYITLPTAPEINLGKLEGGNDGGGNDGGGQTNPNDTAFLISIRGKYTGTKSPDNGFFFSADGRTVQNKASGVSITYTFKSAQSSTKAIYTAGAVEAVFRIGNGNLYITLPNTPELDLEKLKDTVDDAFLDRIKGQTAGKEEDAKYAKFSPDGRTITFKTGNQINPIVATFVKASSHQDAIYKDNQTTYTVSTPTAVIINGINVGYLP